jgi:hypothetical protein
VSNADGAEAADACTDAGLHVAVLDGQIQHELGRLLPAGADVTGPVDTTGGVTCGAFRRCLDRSQATMAWRRSWRSPCPPPSLTWSPWRVPPRSPKPLVPSVLGQAETVRLLRGQPAGSGDQASAQQSINGSANPGGVELGCAIN